MSRYQNGAVVEWHEEPGVRFQVVGHPYVEQDGTEVVEIQHGLDNVTARTRDLEPWEHDTR